MGSICGREDSPAPASYEERQRELSGSREINGGIVGSSRIGLKSSKVNSPITSLIYEERPKSASNTKVLKTDGKLYSYKLASLEELVSASKKKQGFCKTVIEAPKLLERLSDIQCTGKVTLEEGTNFGMILLNDKWQEVQEELLELLRREEVACREDFINQATSQANEWRNLLGLIKCQSGFFTPVSLAGLHISLGKINEEKPDCVVEGKEVRFSISGFTTMPTLSALPKIYPSQKTKVVEDLVLINCPTRWYFANVEVKDFDFPFKYPPHITLGCYGLMNVPRAAIREMNESLKEAGSGCAEYEYGKS